MAENKKSVLLYCDIIATVEELTDEEAGRLFKHYLRYINDLNPVAPDKLTQIAFEPIKQTLKRDLKKWEQKSEKNSEIAKARWRMRNDANACERIKDDAKNADIVIDKVIDKVIERDIKFTPGFESLEKCTEVALKDDRYIRENKTNMRELQIFNKFLSKQGVYEKTLLDYKQHFSNWKASGKMQKFIELDTSVITLPTGTGELARQRKLLNGK